MPDTRIEKDIMAQNMKAMTALTQRITPANSALDQMTGKLEQAMNVVEELASGKQITPQEVARLRAYFLDPSRYSNTIIVQFVEET